MMFSDCVFSHAKLQTITTHFTFLPSKGQESKTIMRQVWLYFFVHCETNQYKHGVVRNINFMKVLTFQDVDKYRYTSISYW